MIIQALKEYYDRKVVDSESGIALPGWEYQNIKYIIVLDKSGNVVDLQNTQEGTGKTKRIKRFLVPQKVIRTSNDSANLLWDKTEYVLGLLFEDNKLSEGGYVPNEKRRNEFRKRLDSLGNLVDPGLIAVRNFVELSLEDMLAQLSKCTEFENLKKERTAVNLSFRLAGELGLVSDSPIVRNCINNLSESKNSVPKGICLVTGKEDTIATLHCKIKNAGGDQSETCIVSFNSEAFESFGKKQGANAPIGESVVFAYTTALNMMLGKDSVQKMFIGKVTMVFWSEKSTTLEEQFMDLFAVEPEDDPDRGTNAVKALYQSASYGTISVQEESERNIQFYVLGLSPNKARLAIRFWIHSTIEEMKTNLIQHFEDMKISRPVYVERDFLPLVNLLVSVAVQGKSENIPPMIEGDLMSAILEGTIYPKTLFNCAIQRIRAQRDVTYPRAAILKAYLNRRLRLDNKNNSQPSTEKEITVSLDTNNTNVGYCLGRLFATLEKIQSEANPGLNTTIRDRFYGSASGTPITVFPNLIRLMTHHLSKMENKGRVVNFEKLIGEILNNVNDFPATLSMEDQGRFALGYYHQKNVFYTAKDSDKNEDDTQTK